MEKAIVLAAGKGTRLQTEGITLQPMNLQKVFVALCDGEDG